MLLSESVELWAGGMPDPFGSASFADYRYSVYCTYIAGGSDEVKSVDKPLKINSSYQNEEVVLIYPNLTEGELTFTWKNRYDHRLNITIYNIIGQVVNEVQTDPDTNEIRINLNGTSDGIYLFEMKDKKNDLMLNRSRIIKK